ncbi:ricin-type beta-trefoil lectin domain protein [Streptomyces mirabilis]
MVQTSSTALDVVNYRYNQAGELTAADDLQNNTTHDTQCFTYDSFQRLTAAWTDTAGITDSGSAPVGSVGGCTTASVQTSAAPVKTKTVGGPAPYWETYTYDLLGDRTGTVDHDTTGNALADTTQATSYPGTDGTVSAAHPDQAGATTISNPGTGSATQTPAYTDANGKNAGNTLTRKTGFTGPLATAFTLSGGGKLCVEETGSGAKVEVNTCSSTATAQKWTIGTDGTVKAAGLCLDTAGNATASGTGVVVDTCSTDATQKWRVTTTGTLVNAAKNTMCLSDPAASATKATQLTLTACGGKGQNWSTIAAGALPAGQTQTFTYDAEGRTATVSTPSGATDRTSKYLYDADGNLLEQTASVGGTDKTRVLYLFGGVEQLTLDVAAKTCTALRYYAGPDGTRITRSSSGGVTYQVANAQGTATTAVDASTLAATRRFYDPYGNPRGTEPPTWVSADENHGFLGMPGDPATGLDLLGARNYDPVLGRFLTPDPVFQVGDPNQMGGYTYAADNPATGSDPTGYDDWAHSDLNTCAPGFVCGGHTPQKTSSPAPTNTSSGNSGGGGGGGSCHGFFGCTGHYLKKAAPYVAVGMVATVVIIGAGSCTLESGGLLAPGCIEGGAAGFTAACGAFLGDCGPGPGGDPTAEDAGEDTPRTEDANAAAKAGASTEAVDEAAADAKDLADMKRANAHAREEAATKDADAAASEPSKPETGAAGTPATADSPRGTTPRGKPGEKSRPSYAYTEGPPANWNPQERLARGNDLARQAAVTNRTARTAERSYVSGYHVETGELAVASSGPGPVGCGLTFCAEGNVVNALGGDWEQVRFGSAYVAEREGTGFVATGKYVCPECQLDYSEGSFGSGVAGRPDGPWFVR